MVLFLFHCFFVLFCVNPCKSVVSIKLYKASHVPVFMLEGLKLTKLYLFEIWDGLKILRGMLNADFE